MATAKEDKAAKNEILVLKNGQVKDNSDLPEMMTLRDELIDLVEDFALLIDEGYEDEDERDDEDVYSLMYFKEITELKEGEDDEIFEVQIFLKPKLVIQRIFVFLHSINRCSTAEFVDSILLAYPQIIEHVEIYIEDETEANQRPFAIIRNYQHCSC